MYHEVNGRVILFDNRKKSDVKDQQRQQLVSMVDKLMVGGSRYTSDKFEKAKRAYESLLRENKISAITEEVKEETSIIIGSMKKILENPNADYKINALNDLMSRITALLEKIYHKDVKDLHLVQATSIMIRAQLKVEMELKCLQLQKEHDEKERDRKTEAEKETERLRALVAEQAQALEQKEKDGQEEAKRKKEQMRPMFIFLSNEERQMSESATNYNQLTMDYLRMRDEYNRATAPKSCCVM
ncbi:hypothetical protein PoB_001915700 [Plakobranchus ocellatus]|uniref:Uncharacterized protein n=1 Tax=Plakobranchus ocellatus TaxID=259542 RepID=A0AAV3ZDU5_9GAST|nr:hypothetical protein PoB_001915700 [Plakobranchus ocellatus]